MLSIAKLGSASDASAYYEKDNYYEQDSKEAVERSEFYGSLSEDMGIKGERVDSALFKELLEGKLPNGKQLGNEKRRTTGWDQTFSAPKSFSLLVQVLKEHEPEKALLMEKAFSDAVKQTLDYQEKEIIGTRKHTKNDKGEDVYTHVKTGKAVYAMYRHNWSREEDPQSHIHAVTINMTKNEQGEYKSLDSSKLYANKMLNGVMMRNYLAQGLKEIGLGINNDRRTGMFEIRGVSKGMIDDFSKGRNNIKNAMDELGLSGAKMASVIAKTIRKPKKVIIDPERNTLRDSFLESANDKHIKSTLKVGNKIVSSEKEIKAYNSNFNRVKGIEEYTKAAIDFSIRGLSENESVFGIQDIKKGALAYGLGNISIEEINRELKDMTKSKELVFAGEKKDIYGNVKTELVTTRAIYEEEKKVLNKFVKGIGVLPPLANKNTIDKFINSESNTLGKDQTNAFVNILTNKDTFSSVQGDAGTGKTYMFQTLDRFIKNEKLDVNLVLVGMTHKAKQELANATKEDNLNTLQKFAKLLGMREEKEASTLASFLNSDKEITSKDLILVDEASMSSIKDMDLVTKKVENTGARVLFVGDNKQFQSIKRGKIFTQLQSSGVNVSRLSENFRQEGETVKQVALELSDRETEKALKTLTDARAMKEVKSFSRKDLGFEVLDNFISLGGNFKETAIITDTHANKTKVNEILQSHFAKKNGDLNEINGSIYVKQNISNNQKRLVESYKFTDSIYTFKTIGEGKNKIEPMRYHDIESVDELKNELKLKTGQVLPLDDYKKDLNVDKISLYQKEERTFKEKDPILFNATDYKEKMFFNNDSGEVEKITNNHVFIKKEDGKLLKFPKDDVRLKQMDLKYAITSHSSQGGTYKNTIAVMSSEGMLANFNQLYVNTTRAKQEFRGITDNVQKLVKSYIENNGEKLSAVEEVNKQQDKLREIDKVLEHKPQHAIKEDKIIETLER